MPNPIDDTSTQPGPEPEPSPGPEPTPEPKPEDKGPEPQTFDAAYVSKLREEAAGYRTRAAAAERELKERKDAELSERERAEQRAVEAEAKAVEAEKRARQAMLSAEIRTQAVALKMVDPEAAELFVGSQIAFDDDGKPVGVRTALEGLRETKPYLFAKKSGGDPTNPASERAELTIEKLRGMSAAEISALDPELVNKALAAG